MASRTVRWSLVAALALALGAFGPAAWAADKYFDFASSGSTWDTGTTANWGTVSGGPYNVTWANYERAIFEGTGGVVNLSNPYANWLVFAADGYTLQGSTLHMGNPGGTNNFEVTGTNVATIASDISQPYATNIQKRGTGTLRFTGTVTSTPSSGNSRLEGGILEIAGGTSTFRNIWIADSNGTTGTLAVTGGNFLANTGSVIATRGEGTLTVNGTGHAEFKGGLYLGHAAGSANRTATVNVNGGTLAVTGGNVIFANDNTCSAVFNQTAGSFSTAGGGYFYIGNMGAPTQTLDISGGTFAANNTGAQYLGIRGTTTMTIRNTADVTFRNLQYGHPSVGGTATINLDGGTLTLASLGKNNGTAIFNFDGGTLKPSASTTTFLQGLNTADVQAGGAIIDTDGFDITVAQALSGVGGLTKTGLGTLTLTGNNSYTGPTTINSGTLVLDGIGGAYTYQGGDITIHNGSTLRVTASAGSDQYWFNNKNFIFGPTGGGTIDTTNRLNFVVYGGSDVITTGGAMNSIGGSKGINLHAGHTLTFDVADGSDPTELLVSAPLWNSGGVHKTGAGTMVFTAANPYSGATVVEEGVLVYQNGSSSSSHTIAPGAVLELNVASGTRNYGSTSFSGGGTLRKTGAGTAQWPSTSATFALSAGSLIDVQGGTFVGGSYANENWTNNYSDLNVAGGAMFNGVEANVRVGALTGAGEIRSGYGGAGYSTFTFGVGDASGTYDGILTHNHGVGWGRYTKVGTGTQTFTGTIRQIASGGGTGLVIADGTVEIAGAGTFEGGSWSNAMTNNGTFHYNSTADNTMSGVIGGGGALVKSNTGTLTLAGDNTYTGPTTINGGTLVLDGIGGAYTYRGGDITINNGSTLRVTASAGSDQYWFNNKNFIFGPTGGGTIDTSDRLNFVVYGGSDVITSGGARNSIVGSRGINLHAGHTLNFNVADGPDAVDLAVATRLWNSGGIHKTGPGTMALSGSNSYTGLTRVQQGTLVLAGPGAGNNDGAIRGHITIDNGATLRSDVRNVIVNTSIITANGTWDMNGNTEALGYLAGNGAVTNNTNGIWLDLGAGTQTFSGAISGSGGLTLRGTYAGTTGTQVLAGANTYAGGTNVQKGTLLVNNTTGSGTGTGAVTVGGSGVLGGTGTVDGPVYNNAGGRVSPGGDGVIGTFTIGSPADLVLTNVALGGTASQSSTGYGGVPSRAIDGNTSGQWGDGSVTHTNPTDVASWQVDLGSEYVIDSLVVWNRTDCCSERIDGWKVSIPGSGFEANPARPSPSLVVDTNGAVGQVVLIELPADGNVVALSLAEVQVMALPVNYTQAAGAELTIDLAGNGVSDVLAVYGDVDLDGDLALLFGQPVAEMDSWLILENMGPNPILGAFAGLDEGDVFYTPTSAHPLQITYQGGDGNDVALTAVPEPASMALLGAALAGLGGYVHRRRRA